VRGGGLGIGGDERRGRGGRKRKVQVHRLTRQYRRLRHARSHVGWEFLRHRDRAAARVGSEGGGAFELVDGPVWDSDGGPDVCASDCEGCVGVGWPIMPASATPKG